jgi:hypothetical protein
LDLELTSIDFYGNDRLYTEFKELKRDNSKVKYLFHGAGDPGGFLNDGFDEKRKGQTDGGWYGVGFYLTSFLDYALCYQYKIYDFSANNILNNIQSIIRGAGGSLRILLMLCNLGNCRTIGEFHMNEPLPNGVDSYYIRVQAGKPAKHPPHSGYPIFDEFVFKNKYSILPQFIVTLKLRSPGKLVVWRNTSFKQYHDYVLFDEMKERFKGLRMIAYDCDDDAIHRITKTKEKTKIFVLSNRANDGDKFLTKCRHLGVQTPMMVFCNYVRNWIPMEGVTVSNSRRDVLEFIENIVLPA